MYCQRCGNQVPDEAAFCPRCGLAHGRRARPAPTTDSGLIVLTLIVFFPLGLYLMWRSHWDDDVKWAISGILLPPLWTRFVWRQPWTLTLRSAAAALLVIVPLILDNALFGIGPTASVFLALVNVVVALLVIRSLNEKTVPAPTALDRLRRSVADHLARCHDLILEVERSDAVDRLPDDTRRQYVHALELQSEATRLFEQATTESELAIVDARINEAIAGLRSIQTVMPQT